MTLGRSVPLPYTNNLLFQSDPGDNYILLNRTQGYKLYCIVMTEMRGGQPVSWRVIANVSKR